MRRFDGDEFESRFQGNHLGSNQLPLPVADVSCGLSMSGRLTQADDLAARKRTWSYRPVRWCEFMLLQLVLILGLVYLCYLSFQYDVDPVLPPKFRPEVLSFLFGMHGVVAAWAVSLIAMRFTLRVKPPPPRPWQYVFQPTVYYGFDDGELHQTTWRGVFLSRQMVVLTSTLCERQAVPRRFCRDEATWNDFLRRLSLIRPSIPYQDLPESPALEGPHEELAFENVWPRSVVDAPILGRSTGMWNVNEAVRLVSKHRERNFLLSLAAAVAAMAVVAWSALPASDWTWCVWGAAVGGLLFACDILWEGPAARKADANVLAERTEMVTTVRETGVELISAAGRSFYLWSALTRSSVTDDLIGLFVKSSNSPIVLAKRLYPPPEWRRIVDRVTALPPEQFSQR